MIINIVLTTICHSLCAAVSITFFIAALMSGWDTGETMFAFMFLGIIQGAAISSLGLLALRSRGLLPNWRKSLLATASYITGASYRTMATWPTPPERRPTSREPPSSAPSPCP